MFNMRSPLNLFAFSLLINKVYISSSLAILEPRSLPDQTISNNTTTIEIIGDSGNNSFINGGQRFNVHYDSIGNHLDVRRTYQTLVSAIDYLANRHGQHDYDFQPPNYYGIKVTYHQYGPFAGDRGMQFTAAAVLNALGRYMERPGDSREASGRVLCNSDWIGTFSIQAARPDPVREPGDDAPVGTSRLAKRSLEKRSTSRHGFNPSITSGIIRHQPPLTEPEINIMLVFLWAAFYMSIHANSPTKNVMFADGATKTRIYINKETESYVSLEGKDFLESLLDAIEYLCLQHVFVPFKTLVFDNKNLGGFIEVKEDKS